MKLYVVDTYSSWDVCSESETVFYTLQRDKAEQVAHALCNLSFDAHEQGQAERYPDGPYIMESAMDRLKGREVVRVLEIELDQLPDYHQRLLQGQAAD